MRGGSCEDTVKKEERSSQIHTDPHILICVKMTSCFMKSQMKTHKETFCVKQLPPKPLRSIFDELRVRMC